MISAIIKVEVSVISGAFADNTYRDLDYLGYHKTESKNCFIIRSFEENNDNTPSQVT